MNIINFISHFPDEESCEQYLKANREKQGIYCKNCKEYTKHYWFSTRKVFECSNCRRRTSLKAGTVMQNSNLLLHTWFAAFLLMSATKKGLTCMELPRQLGLKKYDTAFLLMHKIRTVMGKRDDSYMLKGMVEYDEAYVEKAIDAKLKKQLKRGKGSQRQVIVAVAAESTPSLDEKTQKTTRYCGFFKMKVIPKADAASVDSFVEENIDKKSVVFTDGNKAYVHLEKLVETHIKVTSTEKSTNEELNWVNKAISNLKKNLLGIYHMVTEKYIQNYIDEFVYKLNRRYFGEKLFDRLIIAAIQTYV